MKSSQDPPRERRQPSLYEVLQVSPGAPTEVIRAAYRALAFSYHPDRNPSESAARLMRQLNAAYEVLVDSERRARYDAQRALRHPARAPVAEARRTANTAPTQPMTHTRAPRRPQHAPRRPARLVGEVYTFSPFGRIMVAAVLIGIVVASVVLALWLVTLALDEAPSFTAPRLVRNTGSLFSFVGAAF